MSLPQYIDASDSRPVATLHDESPTVYSVHSDEFGSLPGRWDRRFDYLGRNYYVDHKTGTTMLDRPSLRAHQDTKQQGEASYHHNSYQLIDESLSDGDSSTQVSSPMSPVAAQQRAANPMPFRPLPPGWEERRTQEGSVYFFDCKSNLDISLGAGKMKPILLVLS